MKPIPQYPAELADSITMVYNCAIRSCSVWEVEAIHNFLCKDPEKNGLKCLDGKNLIHKSNKLRFYSRRQAGGAYFLKKRNRPTLYLSDLKNVQSLLTKLIAAEPCSFAADVYKKFCVSVQNALREFKAAEKPTRDLKKLVVGGLNQIILHEPLYDERFFGAIEDLPLQLRILITTNPQGENLVLLNRLLLQMAFPEISKVPTPPINMKSIEDQEIAASSDSPLEIAEIHESVRRLHEVLAVTIAQLEDLYV